MISYENALKYFRFLRALENFLPIIMHALKELQVFDVNTANPHFAA
jgi:hypothetical protein